MFDQLLARATLHAAFARVRDNAGCRGADGVTVGRFAEDLERHLDHLEGSLRRGRYRPFPLLRFEVAKNGPGMRHLCVPTVRDRVLQTAVDLVVRDVFEAEFEDASHAFRRGRSVRTAIRRIDALRQEGYRFVVDADVDGFFDSIPHDRLFARLSRLALDPRIVDLLRAWTRAEVYDGRRVVTLARGIPQGSVVSPLLANLVLDELDENLALLGLAAVRYSDDFLVLCKTAAGAAEALELTDYLLAEMELALHREKTRTTSFDEGFRFLGAVFLKDAIYLPFDAPKPERAPPVLPPTLDLLAYLELREPG